VTFANYASVAGNFLLITSPIDGIFKIVTANPTSYADMYNSAKNFKGFSFIDRARTIMWNTENDSTGLYGSFIDAQDSDVYTTVASEATVSLGGTLAFKAAGQRETVLQYRLLSLVQVKSTKITLTAH